MSKFESKNEKCEECGGRITLDEKRGEVVCSSCGLVNEVVITCDQEWRAFDQEQKDSRSRVGPPSSIMVHDKGLPTEISWQNKDSSGKRIVNPSQVYRMRKWQKRIRANNATERNLAYALAELHRLSSSLSLPKPVQETAAMIYRKAVKANLIRGRSIEGVSAAALYAACRQCNVPRTLDEIANGTSVNRKEIGRTFRFISRKLSLKLVPTNPLEYVPRFCSELKQSMEVQLMAIDILKRAAEKDLISGRGPTGVAAAAIYIASILSGERRTQREVALCAGCTEVTIRNRYSSLIKNLNIDIAI